MKILLGIDDSPHSRAALEYVRKTSWPAGTRIIVLSVAQPMVTAYAEVYAPAAPYLDRAWEDQLRFHQEITSNAERELHAAGVSTEARVLHGDPREAIVDAAREERVDLVVLGSHGRTGLSRLVMGSVAQHVVGHAPCSVLVVKLPVR
jgi:universal stress protein A